MTGDFGSIPPPDWTDTDDIERWLRQIFDEVGPTRLDFIADGPEDELKKTLRQATSLHLQKLLHTDNWHIEEAKHGNLEPLRHIYPTVARYINLPKGERGRRTIKKRQDAKMLAAERDLFFIRSFFKAFARPKLRGQQAPEYFAATLHGLDVDQFLSFLKPSGRKRDQSEE